MSVSARSSCLRRWWLGAIVVACLVPVARAETPADPLRPAAIVTEDVPGIPPELAERLRQYQSTRLADFADWAPDGEGMLVQTRFGNSAQLHRVYEPGGRREQITFFEEPAGGRFIPKASDGALLVTMSRGGDENFQIHLLDQDDFQTTLLTDGKSRNLLGPVRHDGSQMIVHSNRRNGRDTDLYLADCRKSGSEQLLLQVDGEFWTAQDWARDGSRLLVLRYVSINESYPALLHVGGKLEPLSLPAEGQVAVGEMAFSPDGRSAWLTTDARGEFLELARLDLETREYQYPLEEASWDVSELEVDERSGLVAFTVNENGASRLHVWDGKSQRQMELPVGVATNLRFSPDGKQLGFTLARPDAPADAWSVAVEGGEPVRWTYSETGGLNPATFVRPERIEYSSFDGRQIPAWYFRPRTASADSPAAVLIVIHGGPESQYRPIFSGNTQFYLNELGLAVIHPNVRGSSGYGKSYLKLDNAKLREDSVKDIGALLDWIAGREELDASRVAVAGGSYGGYMVLASLVNFPDRLRAGVDIVGIANFITFLERTSPYRQDLRRAEYGDERDPEIRAFFERINPSASAGKIRSALLVAHGRNDPRVPFYEAEQIAERVRSEGRPVWTVYAGNEGHGFAKKDNRDYLTAVEALFLKEQLVGEPAD